MRQITGCSLWLGHVGEVRDLRRVLDAGILAVVDLALNEPPAVVTRELVYCRFPLLDGAGNPSWLLKAAVATVVELLKSGTPTLVYCGAGMSRTPLIAATAIAQVRGCSLEEGLAAVTQDAPVDLSLGLLAELRQLLAISETANMGGRISENTFDRDN